jgi:hypothetical protein
MIAKGWGNVRTVSGGGAAMEKFFDHYHKTYYGGKIISPTTGKEIHLGFMEK